MSAQCRNFHEIFIALHQASVLSVGLVVITILPEEDFSFFLPFAVAIAPFILSGFAKPETLAVLHGGIPRERTFRLSAAIGIICTIVLLAMWCFWAMMEALRSL